MDILRRLSLMAEHYEDTDPVTSALLSEAADVIGAVAAEEMNAAVRLAFLADLGDLRVIKPDGGRYRIEVRSGKACLVERDTLEDAIDALKEMMEVGNG